MWRPGDRDGDRKSPAERGGGGRPVRVIAIGFAVFAVVLILELLEFVHARER